MAVVRNRRAMIAGVQPSDAGEAGRYHLVEIEYTDGTGIETDTVPSTSRRRLPTEGWAECEPHARALMEEMPAPAADGAREQSRGTRQSSLFNAGP
jgi:hypothetical protein